MQNKHKIQSFSQPKFFRANIPQFILFYYFPLSTHLE